MENPIKAMEQALIAFEEQKARRRHDVTFNTFSLLGVGTDEVKHSAFLAWLLDAEGGHGQGNLFLQAFLATCRPPIEMTLPEHYHVQTEFTALESIADIVIYEAGVFVLYIENKTVSPVTNNQHDREFRDMQRLGETLKVPSTAQYAIYLTPQGRKAPGKFTGQWHKIAYRDLGAKLDELVATIAEVKTRDIVNDWLDTLTLFTGAWRKTMTELSKESLLIAEHWNTVADIIRAKNNLSKELTEILFSIETDLETQDWWKQGWEFRQYKNEIYIFNTHWCNAEGWAMVYMGVYCFNAAHVFELSTPPQFYVRARDGYATLNQELITLTRAAGHLATEGHRHFIHRDLQKCATEHQAAKAYANSVRRQIIDLFSEYATLMMRFDETIRRHVAKAEEKA
ncbi:MAG: PD-(D/E)XK nuclease family protein [Anaerolineae bacterium]|nr:PD-(D/E)XK nuclease family protein [Anaerolineae bacterium]